MRLYKVILTHSLLLVSHSNAQLFSEVTVQSGIEFDHQNNPEKPSEATVIGAGGAVQDYDFDGYPDFYLVGGTDNQNALYKNQGNGTFVNVANQASVNIFNTLSSGPVFADIDGDFDLDLLVFSVNKAGQPPPTTGDSLENRPRLFINLGNGSFIESLTSGFNSGMPSFSGTFGDLDNDGDLDLFMTHWIADETTSKQLFWENNGTGMFTDVTIEYLGTTQNALFDKWTFTPNFTDINNDGWLDVLLTSDFDTTRILQSTGFANNQPTYFITQPTYISDENGMGAALADYDNDGDLDWFVTSIWDPNGVAEANWGVSGNRLYRNTSTGEVNTTFEDATDEAGLRQGYWGWGACFADFNNDGHLDIYHENGFPNEVYAQEFHHDPARLYMANGNGSFTESAVQNGLNHTGQGRGVSCVDYDLDGDIDILIMPNDDSYRLYQNINNSGNYISINLFDTGPNRYALQSKISVSTSSATQMRLVSSGNNYVSNNPLAQHFGLGNETIINAITITWPDNVNKVISNNITSNSNLSISRYCHTTFMTKSFDTDITPTNLELFLHDLDGNPLINKSVTMNVSLGPNSGYVNVQNSNNNGSVIFQLNYSTAGTDRISFNFNAEGESQICRALVKWQAELIFKDEFEGK